MKLIDFDPTQRHVPGSEWRAVEAQMAAVAGTVHAADGQLVDIVADVLTRDLWQGDRIHTPVQWLMWRSGIGRQRARRVVLLAARHPNMPTTTSLLREGRLSLDQAATIARYTPDDYETSVATAALAMSVQQIVNATRRYAFDLEAKPPRDRTTREMAFGHDDDGTWWARIRLPADEGAAIEEALIATRDHLHHTHTATAGSTRAANDSASGSGGNPGRVSWADALVGMAHSALAHNAEGADTTTTTSVHLHLEHPAPGQGREWIATMSNGPALPSWLARHLLCDCDVEIVWNTDGIAVSTSKHHRTPPRRIRRLIEKRDNNTCRVPGCDRTLWLQIHHITHWQDGGPTTTANLCCLCSHHHRMLHRGLLDISGDADAAPRTPDALTFYDPIRQRHLEPVGTTVAPHPTQMPTVASYQAPTGEPRVRRDLLTFTRTPPPTNRQPAA